MPPFRFKQFSVELDGAAHPVGTDSVLLGAWAPVCGARRMLDIGTGTGVVALMLAQRTAGRSPEPVIDAVELHPGSAALARWNFDASPWGDRIRVFPVSIQAFTANDQAPKDKGYDLIVSNPPFFSGPIVSPDPARRLGRDTATLSPGELIGAIRHLLAPDGKACLILPDAEGRLFIELATLQGLYCTRELWVYPRDHKPLERRLLVFERVPRGYRRERLLIYARELAYSEAFMALTGAFY